MPGSPPSKVTDPGNQPAAQDPVQLPHAGLEARQLGREVGQGRRRRTRPPPAPAGRRVTDALFQRVPLGALRALTLPFEGLGAAVGADEDDRRFGHPKYLGREAARKA